MKYLPILLLLLWLTMLALASEPYQKFRKGNCEWCGAKDSMFNKLEVAHFYNQSDYPAWKNVESNVKTLCRKDHFAMHKRNWKKCVPEWCKLFDTTPEKIREICIKETGVVY